MDIDPVHDDEVTASLYGECDREEALRRFPEIKDIRDDELQEQAIEIVQEIPHYFWTAAAASKHHPPEHRSRHGLWLHTKRVVTAFERVAPSMVNQGFFEWYDVDCGRAACILHDMFKYGEPPSAANDTTNDHGLAAAEFLDTHDIQLPDEVIGAVEAHNGPWYKGSAPRTNLEQMVHMADMVASAENIRVGVKDPHPVLKERFPRVSETES